MCVLRYCENRKLGMCRTEGLASARRLHPHGMSMLNFGRTRLDQSPARMCENKNKKEMRDYLIL